MGALTMPVASREGPSMTDLLRGARASAKPEGARGLFEQALPLVYKHCRIVLGSVYPGLQAFDLDAVVQDAVVKVWSCLGQYNTACRAERWIARIAINTARDSFRSSRRFSAVPLPALEDNPKAWKALAGRSEEAGAALLEQEFQEQAFARLSPSLTETAHLRVAGLNSREIAEKQGIPASTTRGRLTRIRRIIESLIAAEP